MFSCKGMQAQLEITVSLVSVNVCLLCYNWHSGCVIIDKSLLPVDARKHIFLRRYVLHIADDSYMYRANNKANLRNSAKTTKAGELTLIHNAAILKICSLLPAVKTGAKAKRTQSMTRYLPLPNHLNDQFEKFVHFGQSFNIKRQFGKSGRRYVYYDRTFLWQCQIRFCWHVPWRVFLSKSPQEYSRGKG